MNKLISAIAITACLFAAGQSYASDTEAIPSESKGDAVVFELKGIALGDDMESAKAEMPGADCETMSDGSITQCFVYDTTFGGKPADLLVRFLDGKVVYIAATKMTQEDAFDAADGLKVKFGAPSFMDNTRVTIVRPKRDRSLLFKRPVWKSADGSQEMKVNPAQYTDNRRQFTYAAVVLFDAHLHNDVWMAKMRNTASVDDL